MNAYDIYMTRKGQPKAIKNGFSWFGFLFSWLWTYARGMYGIGTMQCIAWVIFLFFGMSFFQDLNWLYLIPLLADLSLISSWVFTSLSILCFLLMLILHFYVGIFCNNWVRNKWTAREWKHRRNVLAPSRSAAIEKFKKRQANQKQS